MHEPGIPVAEVVLEVVSSLLNGRDAVHEVVRALAPDFGHHGVRSRGVADQRGQDCFAGKGISSENLNEHALSIRGHLLHFHIILRITIMETFFVCLREHLWLGGLKLKV